MKRCNLWIILFLALAIPAHAEWQAGASRLDLTPDVKAASVPLGGYAARLGAAATGVHDPVFARALVLTDGTTKVGIVSLDLCFLPANVKAEVVKRVQAAGLTKLDSEHLLLTATHTHCAPDPLAMHSGNTFDLKGWTRFDPKLLDFTAGKIADAILRANERLRPAQIGSSVAAEPGLNRNRRGDTLTDPDLTVVSVKDKAGKYIASIVNFAAHPTLYDDKMREISADWPGIATAMIEKQMEGNQKGEKTVCLFLNGAEGDASPNGVDDKQGEDKVVRYGLRVGLLTWGQLTATETKSDAPLRVWMQKVALPPRKPNALFYLAAAQLGASQETAKQLVNGLMPEATTLHYVRIGDLLLMAFPCEPTAAIGLKAKELARKAGYKTPAVVALTDDWLAYCVTPEQYRAGKYESMMSFYGDQIGPTLLTALETGVKQEHPAVQSPVAR